MLGLGWTPAGGRLTLLSFAAGEEFQAVGSEFPGWGDVPVQGLAGDAEFGAEVADLGVGLAHRGGGQAELGGGHLEGPAAFAAAGAGGGQSGDGAFGDNRELGQGGKDPEDQFPGGCGGVDGRALPGQHLEPDTTGGQVMDGVDQVVQVPPQPVELPHEQGVADPSAPSNRRTP